jgi:hypothetical protein
MVNVTGNIQYDIGNNFKRVLVPQLAHENNIGNAGLKNGCKKHFNV